MVEDPQGIYGDNGLAHTHIGSWTRDGPSAGETEKGCNFHSSIKMLDEAFTARNRKLTEARMFPDVSLAAKQTTDSWSVKSFQQLQKMLITENYVEAFQHKCMAQNDAPLLSQLASDLQDRSLLRRDGLRQAFGCGNN